ncbi:MAG: ATP-dependent helicase [Desulfobacteraceae bacterium]|nr:ATP-dependent helicase [Desulfobacteraceae bacterium]
MAYPALLNSSQLEAVTVKEGPVLVIAGAGSGKTRALTYRVARLVEDSIPPQTILLLTFTRKASQEMLRRAANLLDDRCRSVSGGTFHSFANLVLRQFSHYLGISPSFAILDRADAETLVQMIRKDLYPGSAVSELPRKNTLVNIFSSAINKRLSIQDLLTTEYMHFHHQKDAIQAISDEYTRRKKEDDFVDYDDLLVYLYQLLKQHAEIRKSLGTRYQYIMVDEYQDTNAIQADIISLLCRHHKNIMVVGDDAQSIYGFRGASFENIMRFPERFDGTRIIKLEQNYRSSQPILDLSNEIIDQAAEKYPKRLFTKRRNGLTPVLASAGSESHQSAYVLNRIHHLNSQGLPLSEIAVLFRAGFHSFDLEIELARNDIKYVKYGGFKFMESAHIKDLLAHLKVIAAPKDRLSWYRILLLLDHIGPKTAQAIYSSIQAGRIGVRGIHAINPTKKSSGLDRLKGLYAALSAETISVSEMGDRVLAYYHPILASRYDDHPKRLKDLEQLVSIMDRYSSLNSFLSDMTLEPPSSSSDGTMDIEAEAEDRLTLSTVHSAKGLEWKAVFIIWALDGKFPSGFAMDDPDAIEEERRLMYVASTRAKDHLHFIYPENVFDRQSQLLHSKPSRFLENLSESNLDCISYP